MAERGRGKGINMDHSLVRRPLTLACLGFSFGIFLQYHEKSWVAMLLLVALTLLVATTIPSHCRFSSQSHLGESGKQWKSMLLPAVVILLLSFTCGCLNLFLEAEKSSALEEQEGKSVILHGEVNSVQDKGDYGRVLMRGIWAETVGAAASGHGETEKYSHRVGLKENILITLPGEAAAFGLSSFAQLVGKEVTLRGIVERPPGVRNPGGFDYRLYLRTKGVFVLLKAGGGTLDVSPEPASPILHKLALAKEAFAQKISASCDEEVGGLILGMLFGDKSYLEESLYEDFQKNGVAHLLAVSGIHVNVVYLYVAKLLGGRRDLWPSLAVLLFLLVYAALSGFSPSVMRATLMIGISMAAILFRRSYDMCSGLSAAAIILLLFQPYRLFDLGFQLSFLAVFSIAVVLPWVTLKWKELADSLKKEWFLKLDNVAGPLFTIQGMMIPVTAYCFHYFSWSSFLLNPILIPLAGIIVPMGIVAFPLSFFPGTVGEVLFRFGMNGAAIPAKLMLLCTDFFSEGDTGSFPVVSPAMGLLILFYVMVFFFCSESRYILLRRGYPKTVVALTMSIFIFASVFPFSIGSAAAPHPLSRQSYPMVFVDVGQGDCLHLRTPGGKNILIDGGGNLNYNVGKKVLAPYLLKNGISRIDLALVTHLHQDHYKGIVEVAAELPVKRLGVYEANQLRTEELKKDFPGDMEFLYLKKGDRIQVEEGIYIDILAPEQRPEEEYRLLLSDEEDENGVSLVLMVNYRGLRTIMTGDMGFSGEEALLMQYDGFSEALTAHLLKVGHHGSRYSTSALFLDAVLPEAAIIQVGKNNFGHPSGKVIELLRNYGIITCRNDLHGAVLVEEIASDEAVLSDVLGEKIWHIRL